MTLGRKFARSKWYLWPGHMLNQQHLYARGGAQQRGVRGVQYNRGPYNYGIKALSANRFRMWQILLCLLLLLLCMPQFEIKRERDTLATRGEGCGWVRLLWPKQAEKKIMFTQSGKKERKPGRKQLGSVSPHLTSSRFLWRTPARIVCDFAQWSEKAVNLSSLPFPTPYPVLAIRLKPKPLAKRTQHATQIK